MILRFLFLFLFILQMQLFALEKRDQPASFTTSIIVPCGHSHYYLLPELLDHLSYQTKLPDEVVISLSGTQELDIDNIRSFESKQYPFQLTLLKTSHKLSAGQNRNLASDIARGDILIYQDADDLPHPQRTEMICFFFEQFELDHLLHLWQKIKPFPFMDPSIVKSTKIHSYDQMKQISLPVHNGNLSILRSVFKTIKWDPTWTPEADITFTKAVHQYGFRSALIEAPLVSYRPLGIFFKNKFEASFNKIISLFRFSSKSSKLKALKGCIKRYGKNQNKYVYYRIKNAFKALWGQSAWDQAVKSLKSGAFQIAKKRLGNQFSRTKLVKKSNHLAEFILRFLMDHENHTIPYWVSKKDWKLIQKQEITGIMNWIIDSALFSNGKNLKVLTTKNTRILIQQALQNFYYMHGKAQKKIAQDYAIYQSLISDQNKGVLSHIDRKLSKKKLPFFVEKFGPHLSVIGSFHRLIMHQIPYSMKKIEARLEEKNLESEELMLLLNQIRNYTTSVERIL